MKQTKIKVNTSAHSIRTVINFQAGSDKRLRFDSVAVRILKGGEFLSFRTMSRRLVTSEPQVGGLVYQCSSGSENAGCACGSCVLKFGQRCVSIRTRLL
jgi:hypothetical protein